jgi:SAM-dependent methyltransferase
MPMERGDVTDKEKAGFSDNHTVVRRYYNERYYHVTAPAAKATSHLRRLASRLGVRPGQSLLDVACGSGVWLLAAHLAGMKVAGIDISNKAVEAARKTVPGADIRCGVAEKLPWEDKTFDVVTCLGSLEHFVDKKRALSEMNRIAKTDAQILILVPNAGFLTRRLGLFTGTEQAAVIEEVKTLSEWNAFFEACGLRVVERWRDLHVLSKEWIMKGPWYLWPFRIVQALLLAVWPLSWQYQVYHLCRPMLAADVSRARDAWVRLR